MSAHELVDLPMSPFSQRAKWALDAAGVTYVTSPYPFAPFYIQEVPLRWRIGNLTGKITSPILITAADGDKKSEIIMDSTKIAAWAQQHSSSGAAAALFPQGSETEVKRWVTAVDQTLSLMRKGFATARSGNALIVDAALPPGSSGISAAMGRFMMSRIFKKIATKYGEEDSKVEQEKVLADLRAAQQQISSNPNKLLLAGSTTPSYADIALATMLNSVAGWTKWPLPAAAGSDASGQQQTIADAVPEFQLLVKEFGDLLAWAAQLAKQHWPAAVKVYKL